MSCRRPRHQVSVELGKNTENRVLFNFIEICFFTAFFEVVKNRVFWSKFGFQRRVKHAKNELNDEKLTFLVIGPLNDQQDFFFENRLVGTLGGVCGGTK